MDSEADLYKDVEARLRNAPNSELYSFTPSIAGLRRLPAEQDITSSHLKYMGDSSAIRGDPGGGYSVYRFTSHPDTYFIPGFLGPYEQEVLCHQCLSTYTSAPNRTNLSNELPEIDLGKVWRNTAYGTQENKEPNAAIFKRLRWATLGHQYNWGSRKYDAFEQLPEELAKLATTALEIINNTQLPIPLKMEGDAAILNLYRNGDRLRGHKDDAEMNLDVPLVSVSVGAPCLFLLGHLSRGTTPQPVLIRGGDCIVLSKKDRLVYHGVVRLLSFKAATQHSPKQSNSPEPGFSDVDVFDADWKGSRKNFERDLPHLFSCDLPTHDAIKDLLNNTRLNLSIRQV